MNDNRHKIDHLDEQIMTLLNERFKIVKEIGRMKLEQGLPIANRERELVVLSKANSYLYDQEIKMVYETLFQESRHLQTFAYGLIGKHLPYTDSPTLYQAMGLNQYQVMETNDFQKTIHKIPYLGLNVTIPYKEEAYRYCKEHDVSSELTGVVNTIVGEKGYNTDYLAAKHLFQAKNIHPNKVIIIGNGATSRSMAQAITGEVVFLVRNIRKVNDCLLTDYRKHLDAEMIINTTPYGTYPEVKNEPLFPLNEFKQLKWVMDVVYHPIFTPLIRSAIKQQCSIITGYELLVHQAVRSMQLMTGKVIDPALLFQSRIPEMMNIVLIGMPFSGKSHCAKRLSTRYNREFIDMDIVLSERHQDLKTVLKTGTEADYRQFEVELAEELKDVRGKIISTGGGLVLSSKAMEALSPNGLIVFLNPPLETLISRIDDNRPLVASPQNLETLYHQRYSLYQSYADLVVSEEDGVINNIYEVLHH